MGLLKMLQEKQLTVVEYSEEDISGEITVDDRNIELQLSKIDKYVNKVVEERHCQMKTNRGVLENYTKEEAKTPQAPLMDER